MPGASSHVSKDHRTYHWRLVGNSECGGADRQCLADTSPVAMVYVRKRLPSHDPRARLHMEHNANSGIDVVADVEPPCTEKVRRKANCARLDSSDETIARRDKLLPSAGGGQQRMVVNDAAVAPLPLNHAPERLDRLPRRECPLDCLQCGYLIRIPSRQNKSARGKALHDLG